MPVRVVVWWSCGREFSGNGQASFEATQSFAAVFVRNSHATPPPTFKVLFGIGGAAFHTGEGPGRSSNIELKRDVVGSCLTLTGLATLTSCATPRIGPIAAATLLVETGDPFRFASESKFARWCGTGAVALSSGEGHGQPVRHRLDFRGNRRINSVLYIASVTQQRDNPDAKASIDRKITDGETRHEARRSHKRHLANRAIRRMPKRRKPTPQPTPPTAAGLRRV